MAQFVMIAGGWHGGWTLTPVARKLRARGHEVFTPSLTGLGERAHLAAARPNLGSSGFAAKDFQPSPPRMRGPVKSLPFSMPPAWRGRARRRLDGERAGHPLADYLDGVVLRSACLCPDGRCLGWRFARRQYTETGRGRERTRKTSS
jgi:hypothetical protein